MDELQQTPLCWCEKLLVLPFHLVSCYVLLALVLAAPQLAEARPSSVTKEKGVNLMNRTGAVEAEGIMPGDVKKGEVASSL